MSPEMQRLFPEKPGKREVEDEEGEGGEEGVFRYSEGT
jgi:hypothetical protein